jgi:hypothetical protein
MFFFLFHFGNKTSWGKEKGTSKNFVSLENKSMYVYCLGTYIEKYPVEETWQAS